LRDNDKEYKRRNVQTLLVMAQEPFQLKKPKSTRLTKWPREIPPEVLFDPVSTVSATYGVALQTRFRGGPLSSRPMTFVIDKAGVIRHVDSLRDSDVREKRIFPLLDKLDEAK
jgi:peroxiredoxin